METITVEDAILAAVKEHGPLHGKAMVRAVQKLRAVNDGQVETAVNELTFKGKLTWADQGGWKLR